MSDTNAIKALNDSFGNYRAEWLREHLYEVFTEPAYFAALQSPRPCVLEGGRGTGKTTVLRGLSYEGQFALHNQDKGQFNDISFIGLYHNFETNHVRAFKGAGRDPQFWERAFGHYVNLIICRAAFHYLRWYDKCIDDPGAFEPADCEMIGTLLHLNVDQCASWRTLANAVDAAALHFQAALNNLSEDTSPRFSMFGDPIRFVTEKVLSLPSMERKACFYILLDEYENLDGYQQRMMNTLIKHGSGHYVFKIGVRELGWRDKTTLNEHEVLYDPADYVLINIERYFTTSGTTFSDFALKVCQHRFQRLPSVPAHFSIEASLQSFTVEQEAEALLKDGSAYIKEFDELPGQLGEASNQLPLLLKYFIAYWARWHGSNVVATLQDFMRNRARWLTRYENYKYDLLFKLRIGKRGIRKYYCGWDTYTKLAEGNIRYLMELLNKTYSMHLEDEHSYAEPVEQATQTKAAQAIGLKNLTQLEGLWKNGAQLTKLLLGFGRIFQVYASEHGKSAPEKNQFAVEGKVSAEIKELLDAAVMNLAIVRIPGNKLTSDSETKQFMYMIHPIYSAYFEFSYRRKRKIVVTSDEIQGIVTEPKGVIRSILRRSSIELSTSEAPLPEQMKLFERFYDG